jgi:hypothetical protein
MPGNSPPRFRQFSVVFWWCFGGVEVVLWWRFGGVMVVLWWCFSGVRETGPAVANVPLPDGIETSPAELRAGRPECPVPE